MRRTMPPGTVAELPDRIRESIRRETEEGLARFRARDFEAELRRRLRAETKAPERRPALLRWAPAAGLALVAVAIAAGVLWLGRAGAPGTAGPDWIEAFGGQPGFRALDEARAGVSAGASTADGVVPAPGPRYSLEDKMRILYGEKMIERALASYSDRFKGGLT